ncbi:fatty acyl-AMP ligase [Smaragdicoccus niigatensis]|uniref:fatty acyl-AMP ligase n=1 Tax=Smaragdicoccus niigatensis TaxID=359359 RepID=UPI00035D18B3|nr:fatty acyl-AMP ligase [Smaragdicoccus niigatensis]
MTSELVTHLIGNFESYGDARTFTFLREAGRSLVPDVITYRELDRNARETAAWLGDHAPADRPVLLLFEPGIDFWKAFLGCLYAGIPAIPAPLPHDQRSMARVTSILTSAGASLALTTENLRELFVGGIAALGLDDPIDVVAIGDATRANTDDWTPPVISNAAVAFLQYTSGSTGDPKGVEVSHSNVFHNLGAISQALEFGDHSVVTGWIPHFHDMGLIGSIIAFYNGANLVSMAPLAFLKQPVRMLQAIHDYRGTAYAAPNFSYDLIARRTTPEQIAALDLSSWKVAINGAEPIRQRAIERFLEVLEPAGFAPSVMRPAYGMAEVTLMATVSRGVPKHLSADADALEQNQFVSGGKRPVSLVSSGPAAPGIEVITVNPETCEVLPEDHVGEIWLRGESIAAGYRSRPVETEERFNAFTSQVDGPYLRTGDLGFLHDGELYVTGRCKDLLIVNGRNLYPQDIEEFVQDLHPAIAGSRGVAVSLDANEAERLVLIQAVRPELLGELNLHDLASKVRLAIARDFEVPAPSIVFVERSAIHLTTSGKVQRASMKAAFQSGELTGVLHETLERALVGVGT